MIETIIAFSVQVFPLVFTANLVMSVVKYLADRSITRGGLRFILAVFAIVGVISTSAVTGQPIDFDSLSSLGRLAIEAAATGIFAHFSYKAIKG